MIYMYELVLSDDEKRMRKMMAMSAATSAL